MPYKIKLFTILTVLCAIGIFYLSSLPVGMKKQPFPHFDKLLHFFVFMVLSFLIYGSLREYNLKKALFLLAFAIGIFYGATDEIHQYFVPGRQCSIWDWFADFTGAFIGALLAKILLGLKTAKTNTKLAQ